MQGIKVADLEATITAIEASPALCPDFEGAQLLLAEAARRMTKHNLANRTVLMAQTRDGNYSGGGCDRSGYNGGRPPNTPLS